VSGPFQKGGNAIGCSSSHGLAPPDAAWRSTPVAHALLLLWTEAVNADRGRKPLPGRPVLTGSSRPRAPVDTSPSQSKRRRSPASTLSVAPSRGLPGTKVGFADKIRVAESIIDEPAYIEAAEAAKRERNAGFMTVMRESRYADAYIAEAGDESPRFTDEELRTIASPLEFVGINIYRPELVRRGV
jgi:hypothetical protein